MERAGWLIASYGEMSTGFILGPRLGAVLTYSGGERVLESQTGRVTNCHILTLICELGSEGVEVSMLRVEGP